jgi:formamidopyrimidine-DNA glycosylase
MPELPEVETVARALRGEAGGPGLVGRTIQAAKVLWGREIGNMPPRAFERSMPGLRVEGIGRHGKYLLIYLAPSAAAQLKTPNSKLRILLVHLKMSGRLDVVPEGEAFTKHARVVWLLDAGLALRFDDARKFGRVWLTEDPAEVVGALGPDALAVSEAEFIVRLRRKRGALKPVLLDQRFIAGVGNIYADESLFRAGLHPRRLANTLSDADATRLFTTVREVLVQGIDANGASFDWVYPGGNFQDNFLVYGRTGQACAICGRPITRTVIGQRSTHYCAFCQR